MTKPTMLTIGIGSAALICLIISALLPAPWAWLAIWTAVSCGLVSAAYALNLPGIFGKRDGGLPWHRRVVLGPYLLAFGIACELMRRSREAAPVDEVLPGLYVGGRITAEDLPDDVHLVVDLVAEFAEPTAIRQLDGYRALPILDGGYPADEVAFAELLEEAAACARPVLVHCDSGKGRAPTFAALILIRRGLAGDPESAFEIIRNGRPTTAPTASDLAFARRVMPLVRSGETTGDLARMRARGSVAG